MTTLFEFNVPMIDNIAGTMIFDYVERTLAHMEDQVHWALEREAPDEEYDVSWEKSNLVVGLDEQQAASEFGDKGSPRPVVRVALLNASEQMRMGLKIRV